MEIREALQAQAPSLPLVRAAADEIARLDAEIARLRCLVDGYAAAPSAAREREALTDEIAQLICDLDGAYTPHEMAKQIAQRFASPASAPAPAEAHGLTRDDLDLCRQWFNSVQDTNGGYLDRADYALAERIYRALSLRVPSSITDPLGLPRSDVQPKGTAVATVKVMGSVNGERILGCLIDKQAQDSGAVRLGDRLYTASAPAVQHDKPAWGYLNERGEPVKFMDIREQQRESEWLQLAGLPLLYAVDFKPQVQGSDA